MITVIWFLVAALFVMLELIAPGLFFGLSIAMGSVFAGILSLYGYSFFTQLMMLIFASTVTAIILFIFLRWLQKTSSLHESNVYALIGKKGIIKVSPSSSSFGTVLIDGEEWLCKSVNDIMLKSGTSVTVREIRGAHVMVE